MGQYRSVKPKQQSQLELEEVPALALEMAEDRAWDQAQDQAWVEVWEAWEQGVLVYPWAEDQCLQQDQDQDQTLQQGQDLALDQNLLLDQAASVPKSTPPYAELTAKPTPTTVKPRATTCNQPAMVNVLVNKSLAVFVLLSSNLFVELMGKLTLTVVKHFAAKLKSIVKGSVLASYWNLCA